MKTRLATLAILAAATLGSLLPSRAVGQAATPVTAVPPVLGTPFYQGVPQGATIPRVVPELSVPRPLSENVSASIQEIRITFDQPMDTALFYWPLPLNDPYFPFVRADPYWTNNNQTIVIPVQLSSNRVYSIPINSPTMVFRGSTGLYANPGLFRFATDAASGGSVPGAALNTQAGRQRNNTFAPVIPTAVPGGTPIPNAIGSNQANPAATAVPNSSRVSQPRSGTIGGGVTRGQGFGPTRTGGRLATPTPRTFR